MYKMLLPPLVNFPKQVPIETNCSLPIFDAKRRCDSLHKHIGAIITNGQIENCRNEPDIVHPIFDESECMWLVCSFNQLLYICAKK